MAKKDDKPVEGVLLRDCVFGKGGDVVELSAADAEQAIAQGMADLHPNAIKHAKAAKAEAPVEDPAQDAKKHGKKDA